MPSVLTDEEAFPDLNGSSSGRKTSLPFNSLDILSVNQLLESVSWPLFLLVFVVSLVLVFLIGNSAI